MPASPVGLADGRVIPALRPVRPAIYACRAPTIPAVARSPAVPIGPHWMILWPFDPTHCGLPTSVRDTKAWIRATPRGDAAATMSQSDSYTTFGPR